MLPVSSHNQGMLLVDYLFRGFAAEAPLAALETVRTLSTNYQPIIEEDQPVSINAA